MLDHVVVDVEIQKTIEETPGGWNATDKLGVAVACLWEYKTSRMRVYGPEDVPALQERLLKADRISGFNIYNFDFPVIWGISKAEWISKKGERIRSTDLLPKTDDMLRRIWQSLKLDPDNFYPKTHGGYSLDKVAAATLNNNKIGNGADAPKWFQAGKWARVANYCADDVALERDLCDFIDRYGYIQVLMNGSPRMTYLPEWKGGS